MQNIFYILLVLSLTIPLVFWLKREKKRIRYLDYLIYWSIIFIPFSIAIAPAFTYLFMGFLFYSFILKKIIRQEKLFIRTPIGLPFLFLFLISLVSFKNSLDYQASFRGISKIFEHGLLFLICAEEIRDKKHIMRIALFFILGGCLASIDGLWQVVFGQDFIRGRLPIVNIGIKRATAAFPNANVLGVYLTPISVVAFSLALYYFKKKERILLFLASFILLIGIILSFSRPSALGLYIGLLFMAIIRKDKITTAILIILLLIAPFIMPKDIKDWVKSINYNPVLFMCNADRISIYKNDLNMIKNHPIIGVGVNTFSNSYTRYKLPEPENARTGLTMYAHNNFLHMAGEIGILGLAVFIWLLYSLFVSLACIYKRLKDDYLKVLSLGLTAGLIAFLINGLTETSLYYARVAMLFWYIIGFNLAMRKFSHAAQ